MTSLLQICNHINIDRNGLIHCIELRRSLNEFLAKLNELLELSWNNRQFSLNESHWSQKWKRIVNTSNAKETSKHLQNNTINRHWNKINRSYILQKIRFLQSHFKFNTLIDFLLANTITPRPHTIKLTKFTIFSPKQFTNSIGKYNELKLRILWSQ